MLSKKLQGHCLTKTNKIVAIKTVAHKLARACFYVLRDDDVIELFDVVGKTKSLIKHSL